MGETGLEPAWLAPRDFKSLVYTNFTTRPVNLERVRDRASPQLVTASCWRRGSESNRRTRLCRPLHDHSATPPLELKGENGWFRFQPFSPGIWSGKGGSNSRPQPWQGCALPTELFPHCCCFQAAHYNSTRSRLATRPRAAPWPQPRPSSGNTPSKSGSAPRQPRSAKCPSTGGQTSRSDRDRAALGSQPSAPRS